MDDFDGGVRKLYDARMYFRSYLHEGPVSPILIGRKTPAGYSRFLWLVDYDRWRDDKWNVLRADYAIKNNESHPVVAEIHFDQVLNHLVGLMIIFIKRHLP